MRLQQRQLGLARPTFEDPQAGNCSYLYVWLSAGRMLNIGCSCSCWLDGVLTEPFRQAANDSRAACVRLRLPSAVICSDSGCYIQTAFAAAATIALPGPEVVAASTSEGLWHFV